MAAGGVTVGSVWLDVLPSMKSFGSTLVKGVETESASAGVRSGEALGDGTAKGLKGKVAALAAVGASVGLAVAGAISQAMEISDGRAKLTAQLGLTAQESERYGRIAGQVYSQAYGESLDQVNEALVAVRRNIGTNLNDADLQGITSTVLSLASTFEVDLGGATAAVGQLIKTGLAPDAKTALDVITAGFQAGVDKSGDFLDTLNEYGTQFRKLGLDAQTATGLMSQGLQAGARDADIVADALKEFSIRAVDGSKTTAAGFQALGLSASDMASKIAQGGPTASAALDLVLDRLRAMPDPVQRSQAAVALFGTQAEDLGDALYALDPSSAIAALGNVAGAADRMNTTLGETASARLQSFTRSLQTGLVDFLGGTVLPVLDSLSAAGASIFGSAWEPVKGFLGFLAGTGGVVAGVILAIAGAMQVWTFAQIALNSALLANPITWVVIAIAALVAAVIYAWNHFEGFRNVVLAVWDGIKSAVSGAWSVIQTIFSAIGTAVSAVGTAAVWLWQNAIVPAFNGIVAAVSAVGTAASWLWSNVLSPVFNFIATAAKVLFAIVVTVVLTPIVLAFQLVGAAAMWLWTNAIQPAWEGIQAVVGAVWAFLRDSVFTPIVTFLSATLGAAWAFYRDLVIAAWELIKTGVAAAWAFLRDSIFTPIISFLSGTLGAAWNALSALVVAAWDAIRNGVDAAWSFLRDSVFAPIVSFLSATLGPAFTVLQTAVITAWNAIRDGINVVWSFLRDSIFTPLSNFVTQTIPNAFNTAVSAIGAAWDKVKAVVRTPIQAVVDVVYNNGIVKVWNWVAGLVGLGTLQSYTLPGYAAGGPITGGRAGKDSVLIAAMPGEYMLSRQAVTAAGGINAVDELHRKLRVGSARGSAAALASEFGVPGFAQGGAVGATGTAATPAASSGGGLFGLAKLKDLWTAVESGIAQVEALAGTTWGKAALGLAKKIGTSVWDAAYAKVTEWLSSLVGGGGDVPAGSGAVVEQVRQAAAGFGWDVPPQWNALSWIISHESGWNPNAQNPTSTAYGLFQFLDSTWGTVGGSKTSNPYQQAVYGCRYIKNRYSTPTGAQAFWQSHHWYDKGGLLPTGWSAVFNGTGSPEPVLTGAQWNALLKAKGGDGGALEPAIAELTDAIRTQQGPQVHLTVEDRSGNPVETARATVLALRLAR